MQYKNVGTHFFRILSQCTRLADIQTDRQKGHAIPYVALPAVAR